jgi:hypothetical protein
MAVEWEYKDFVWDFSGGGICIGNFSNNNMSSARLEFWSHFQSRIMADFQEMLDQGWLPMSSIGPSSLTMKEETRLNLPGYLLGAVFTCGLGLLAPFFFLDQWAVPVELRIKMRRRKGRKKNN